MNSIVRSVLCLALLSSVVGCVSTPVRMGAIPGREYVVVGKGEGRATGLLIETFIPVMQNTRFQTAYNRAVRSGGGDDIINPEISERWFWAYILQGFVTTIKGDAIKYKE